MSMRSVVIIASALALAGCNSSSENSRKAGATPDDSQTGVITAPQAGSGLNDLENTGQLGVTTATSVTSAPDAATTTP